MVKFEISVKILKNFIKFIKFLMASSFDEFIQLINYSRNPGSLQALGSVENLNQITDRIFSSPDFFFYILVCILMRKLLILQCLKHMK